MHDNKVTSEVLFENAEIGIGETLYSRVVDLASMQLNGDISMELELDDGSAGALDVFYEASARPTSIDADRFIKPSAAAKIYDAFAADSGSGADGRDIVVVSLMISEQYRFGATAVGGAVTIRKMILTVQ